MKNDDSRALHAYVDGELDAASILELESRMAADPSLRAAYERLRDTSVAVRKQAEYFRAPAHLRSGNRGARRPAFLAGAFVAVAAIAFAVGLIAGRPGGDEGLASEAVAAHVRANLSGRPIDVVSSDQHTVKPWFSARLPFSPAVADFSQAGFELAGGRLDYIAGEPVAVMDYKRRQHVIDVYVGRGETTVRGFTKDGFNVEQFSAAGLRYYVVSDLNRNELADFVGLLRKSGGA
jgi:anti-sigma factor RsiW